MDQLKRLAELAVVLGANLQPDQVLRVTSEVGQQELVRAVADVAYRRGARFVDVDLVDPHAHRSRLLHAPAGSLAYAPRWPEARIRELDQEHGANIKIMGPTAPGLFADLDPARVDRAQAPRSRAWREVEYRVNNTIVPGPTLPWARSLRPELTPDDAMAALWSDIVLACRLDRPDPVAAWRERFGQLRARAAALTDLRLDAVRLRGPGTELIVGLPPTARWDQASTVNDRGTEHVWNLPSEEVYTVPDRDRVDGHAQLTRPAVVGGRVIDGLRLTFRGGRAVEVSGGEGVESMRAFITRDPGAARLGELALVDGESRIARLGRTFGMILLDENAASHIALGFGFPALVGEGDRHRVNESGDHLDVMVGSEQLEVSGIGADGRERPLLRAGRWVGV